MTFKKALVFIFFGGILMAAITGTHYERQLGAALPSIYPNKQLTTGKADTLSAVNLQAADWCNDHQIGSGPACQQTYSQAHRNVTDAVKKRVYLEYGVSYPQAAGAYEVDHFYPLCAGGSNDISNLWLEPAHVMANAQDYGFHTKDKLEAFVCVGIKNGTISPQEAYAGITGDWVAYYNKLIGKAKLGGNPATSDLDGDTE
jgi:hypothetical protein